MKPKGGNRFRPVQVGWIDSTKMVEAIRKSAVAAAMAEQLTNRS
jgi:hypothetical protein